MSFLLDTNVISEAIRRKPSSGVMRWLHGIDESTLFLSGMSLGELRLGIESLARGSRRTLLEQWIDGTLRQRFGERILPLDAVVCDAWGRIVAHARRRGRPLSVADGFIAATATVHGLTLATRNIGDFEVLDLPLFNPWDLD